MTTLRSNVFLTALAAAGLLLMGSAAPQSSSPTALEPARATQAAPVSSAPTPSSVGTSHPLTVEDVNAWLDGFRPYALKSGNIAGAVVVVVKDGQVLTEKGYGFSDVKTRTPVIPDQTLFRPGSISKLFTWTAVMQLVQEGKINLDTDVNAYLDFRIPPRFGKPITMRDLMTHTPGFEDVYQDQGVSKPAYLTSLGAYLKAHVPERIYPPGEVPAYSNYGAVLAGYIVARLSGEPFDEYIQRHIFAPLDMAHSTFAQPLPAAMRPFMSQGY
ncbi:MAG: serine hydrolase domain-containing protein, partial [Caulobacteraceae bacterium]